MDTLTLWLTLNTAADLIAVIILLIMTVMVGEAAQPDFNGIATMALFDAIIIWRIFA